MPERGEDLLHNRREKLERLRQRGIDPYPPRYHRTVSAQDAVDFFHQQEGQLGEGVRTPTVSVAGRVTSSRIMGKAAFLDLKDGSGRIQAHLRLDVLGDSFQITKDLDLGDFLGISGPLFRTRTGEVTVEVQDLTVPGQVSEAPSRKMARSAGHRTKVPSALRGPDRQPGCEDRLPSA